MRTRTSQVSQLRSSNVDSIEILEKETMIQGFRVSRFPEFQGFNVPRFQGSKIFRLGDHDSRL